LEQPFVFGGFGKRQDASSPNRQAQLDEPRRIMNCGDQPAISPLSDARFI
jgi:hypothetical protein